MADKPFAYTPSPADILYFRKLSARRKLEWLKEANEFVNTFVPQDMREVWERFKRRQYSD